MSFLPISYEDMKERGWNQVDFVLVTGDAYVDHPSFGTAIISRVLERHGYKVAILAQPDYKSCNDFMKFGKPRLGFLINSGNVDSMVNNFSVFKKRRKADQYSPGGVAERRPDRAVIVYANRAKEAYNDVPVVIGGIEASLRRMGHYDYWEDKVRRSILLDSGADILVYGMGERAIVEIADALDSGISAKDIGWISGTCVKAKTFDDDGLLLPTFDEIKDSKELYAKSFLKQYVNNDHINGKKLYEQYHEGLFVVQNPPQPPMEQWELDNIYDMDFERNYHPIYEKYGGIPGIKEVQFSLVSNRGCFGGCSFCAITFHQGRQLRSRSKESLVREASILTQNKDFKGYIHDVGGPTANFRAPSCKKQLSHGVCKYKDCLYPSPCEHMDIDHSEYLDILKTIRELEGVKKVFIRSGIRYDYLMADKDRRFIDELVKYHVSGTLKVAPEHISAGVLKAMRKPEKAVFEKFVSEYDKANKKHGKDQYLIPYFISSHPGSTLDDAVNLAEYLHNTGFIPDQVQDFYPTPGTLSTTMYYTELDPFTMDKIYIPKDMQEKKMQRALIHFHKPENKATVIQALKLAKRTDLINKFYGTLPPSKKSNKTYKSKSNKKQKESVRVYNEKHSARNSRGGKGR